MFVFPQLLLCGLLVRRAEMAAPLRAAAMVLPMTYAYDALTRAAASRPLTRTLAVDVLVLAAVMMASLALGAATLKRRTR
jgi:ABC-2 type transport system permease protein